MKVTDTTIEPVQTALLTGAWRPVVPAWDHEAATRIPSTSVRGTFTREVGHMTPDGSSVLVAEDDELSRIATSQYLQRFGYRVGAAADGPTALREISKGQYDLLILDLGLPGLAGEEVLARLRRDAPIPVIVLTGRSEEEERVRVLDLGADDYLVKPCSLPELEARIRAVLRRGQPLRSSGRIELGALVIDRTVHRVQLAGRDLELTPKEFDLLAFLAGSPGQVFSREELLEHVWGSTQDWQDPATVTEHVRRLRLKIEQDPASPRWLQTVRGVGYRLAVPEDLPGITGPTGPAGGGASVSNN